MGKKRSLPSTPWIAASMIAGAILGILSTYCSVVLLRRLIRREIAVGLQTLLPFLFPLPSTDIAAESTAADDRDQA